MQALPPPVHSGDTPQHPQARPWRPADLLDVWEQGRVQGPAPRALTLLASGFPGADAETLVDLPIDQRDALLLELRERTFGPLAERVAACPACRETVEFTVRLRDLHTAAPARAHGEVEWQGARLCDIRRPNPNGCRQSEADAGCGRVSGAGSSGAAWASEQGGSRRCRAGLLRCASSFG